MQDSRNVTHLILISPSLGGRQAAHGCARGEGNKTGLGCLVGSSAEDRDGKGAKRSCAPPEAGHRSKALPK